MASQLIKANPVLGKKVRNYIHWRYSGTRTCCVITVDGNLAIKVITRCHKRDHYPKKLRNKYRRYTVHLEYVNQYQMNDLWRKQL
ncbi:conserved hypothetical protein [Vibrio phage 501E54-1]|nr:conserved hypothetical protein [Vibrio phage 501E54-1]